MKAKTLLWVPFAIFAIGIGLYPLTYYIFDMHGKGLWASKSAQLIANTAWHTAFYMHITFGGIAMLTGWTQFSSRIRNNYLNLHRTLGKTYVVSVMLSSLAGFYIALFATGGITCTLGFGLLAASWFFTVTKAYTSILKKQYKQHENWMIRNYALTFAAVTLRVYLPFSQALMHIDFITAYRVISWLCWIPNLIIAEIIVSKRALIIAHLIKKPQ
ncbi:MAG TPA: DUF2306 domain-containing protein [Mucilaginibacter sp.]|nr:DUF2306 domain-containing protein [Mucilaginibacter sp.]